MASADKVFIQPLEHESAHLGQFFVAAVEQFNSAIFPAAIFFVKRQQMLANVPNTFRRRLLARSISVSAPAKLALCSAHVLA